MEWTPAEIKKQRLLREWDQDTAAAALGVSRRTLSSWETGQARPQGANRDALIRVYGALPVGEMVLLPQATDMQMIRDLARRLDEHTPPGRKAADMQLISDIAHRLAMRGEHALPEHDLDWAHTEPNPADEHEA